VCKTVVAILGKAPPDRHVKRLEMNSTFRIVRITACPGWVSVNLILAALTVAAE
jgi:hypothetical protein